MRKIFDFVKQHAEELYLAVLILPVLALMAIAAGVTIFGFAYSLIKVVL